MGRVKYFVPVPSSVQDAYTHDQKNGDNLWEKAIREEVQTHNRLWHLRISRARGRFTGGIPGSAFTHYPQS